jgi:hypothetical protein
VDRIIDCYRAPSRPPIVRRLQVPRMILPIRFIRAHLLCQRGSTLPAEGSADCRKEVCFHDTQIRNKGGACSLRESIPASAYGRLIPQVRIHNRIGKALQANPPVL